MDTRDLPDVYAQSPRAVETFVNSEINYGVPIHFLWGKTSNSAKKRSELKEDYTYHQAWCLMITTQSTNI